MGASTGNLYAIAEMYKAGLLPAGGKIADIGCQQLWGSAPADLPSFFGSFSIELSDAELARYATPGTFISEHLMKVGFFYRCFDIVEAPLCEYFDLNTDRVPRRWRNAFDLVLNFGTTEHVLNQYNAMKTMHDLVKPNGLIFSFFIRGESMDHGLLHYSDRFVNLLCAANHYKTIRRDEHEGHTWIMMQKTSANPFRPIVDVQEGEELPQIVTLPLGNRIMRRLSANCFG